MALLIEDARGKGYKASVSAVNRLNVSAKTAIRAFYQSRDFGACYDTTSLFSAATGNEIIYLKNTSKTEKMYIDFIRVGSANAGIFEVYEVTGTPGGTEITPVNRNLTSSNSADATTYGNAAVTGLTLGNRHSVTRRVANSGATMTFDSTLILGFNDAIAVQYTGSTGSVDATIRYWYEGET